MSAGGDLIDQLRASLDEARHSLFSERELNRELSRIRADQDRTIADQNRAMSDQARTILELTSRLIPAGPPIPTITVREIYDLFEKARLSSKSWRIIRGRLRAFVAYFGDEIAMNLTVRMWAAFRELRKSGDLVAGKAIAPITINFELDWVKAMLNFAASEEQKLIPHNPLDKAKREKVGGGRETWLTEEDLQQLLGKCGALLAAFVLVAIDTGLRISEVLKLRRDRMRYAETQGGEQIGVFEFSKRQMKGKRSHMTGITARAVKALQLLPPTDNPFLFPSTKKPGKAFGARHIGRMFRAACEASGIDARAAEGDVRIRCHDLRHSAASAATRRGASLLQVQQMLSHSSPAITARYVHHDEGGVVALAELMEAGAKKELEKSRRRPPQRAPSVMRQKADAATVGP